MFTNITGALIKHWRAQGIVVFNCIDDGLRVCPTQEQAFVIGIQIRKDIQQVSFLINEEKSRWEPSTRIKWIGFMVDSATMQFYVAEEKLQVMLSLIDKLLVTQRKYTARVLSKFMGHAVSMERAFGLQARMMSRSAARLCAAAPHRKTAVTLDDLVRREMRFFVRESAVC